MIDLELIQEKKYRLKYFYFIDTSRVIESIRSDVSYEQFNPIKEKSITALLQTIFSKIIDISAPYADFILSNHTASFHSFFGENPYNTNVLNLHTLSTITLFHHCIIRSFFTHLCDIPEYSSYIKLSSTKKGTVAKGFLKPATLNDNTIYIDETAPSKDNIRNKRLKENKGDFYSTKYLASYLKIDKGVTRTTYSVPIYAGLFCYFLWLERSVSCFSKSLLNDSESALSQIKKYKDLESAFFRWYTPLSNADKLVFSIFTESAYGFSIFPYIGELLDQITSMKPSAQNSLKDLEGQGLINTLTDAINLPITYNRSILLKYALEAILTSDTLEQQFPAKLRNPVTYLSTTPKTKALFSSKSIELLDSYYHMLNQVTLPLIEDLWDVLTYEVSLEKNLNFDCYFKYVTKHYKFITFDYTLLDLTTLPQGKNAKAQNFSYYYNLWEKSLPKDSKNHRDINSTLGSTKKRLQYLLNYYCNTTHANLANERVINTIIHHSNEHPKSLLLREPFDDERDLFFENHVHSIFELAKVLRENAPYKKNSDFLYYFNR